MSAPLLAVRDVSVRHGGRLAVDRVSLALAHGESLAVVGESGAGKTTLARVLAGHRAPDRGEVLWPGRPTAVQLVCQDAFGSLTPGRARQCRTSVRAPAGPGPQRGRTGRRQRPSDRTSR